VLSRQNGRGEASCAVRGQSPETSSTDPGENKTDVVGRTFLVYFRISSDDCWKFVLILREKFMEMKRRILFQE
jgi:hypothetical protein